MKSLSFKRNSNGYTLIELIVALFLTGLLSIFVFNFFVNQHKVYISQTNTTEMLTNAKAAVTELTKVIRLAGSGFPTPVEPIIFFANGFGGAPDTITVRYANIFCESQLRQDMTSSSQTVLYATDNTACFADYINHKLYLMVPPSDSAYPYGEATIIVGVDSTDSSITISGGLSTAFPRYSLLLIPNDVIFYIDNSWTDHPRLWRDIIGPPDTSGAIAWDIEDFQFFFIMENGDTTVNPNDTIYGYGDIKIVHFSITARSPTPLEGFGDPSDDYQRITLDSNVEIRTLFPIAAY